MQSMGKPKACDLEIGDILPVGFIVILHGNSNSLQCWTVIAKRGTVMDSDSKHGTVLDSDSET